MTKRYGNLFGRMFTPEALYAAYLTARRGKRKKAAVAGFERRLGANLQQLHQELHSGSYSPRPYTTFQVTEPKPRLIFAPHFRDVVVQHAIYAVIYPIFDAGFIDDSYGCRVGKGTHRAADQAQRFMRQSAADSYTLQLDIRKFFYRIDRPILIALVGRKIKDARVVELLSMFMRYPDETGIPIGNLLSQLFALIYLNPLDHYIKRELKISAYLRYVDDFILFGLTQEQAADCRLAIVEWLHRTLRLELSRWTIAPVRRGLNFVGFRTWRSTRFIRRHSLHSFSRSLRRGDTASLISIMGNAKHSATYAHFCRRIKTDRPDLVAQLPESHRHACL